MRERRSALDSEIIQNARLAQEYLDIAEVLIMALDTNYNVTMINQKGANVLGYPKEEIIGKNFIDCFLPQRIKTKITKNIKDILEETKNYKKHYENQIVTKNGKELLIAWKNTTLKDENEKVIGILTSGEDITELRKQNQQILQKSRLEQMGEMLSMIAHQWRQPLSAISSVSSGLLINLQLDTFNLKEEGATDRLYESLSSELHKINRYVQNLSTIIDDFRSFYKEDKTYDIVTLDEIVESALNIMNIPSLEKKINFIKEYNSKAEVEVLYGEMTQVIVNILQNAKDNFEEKNIENPQIKIVTHKNGISISDNGGGIMEDIIYKIFDPYFSTKESKNGTGLGLYMSKMILEEHHKGKLIVENIDEGVCFHIDLGEHI